MGEEKTVRYRVPNVNQCKECHDADDKISPIGPKARNINKEFDFKDGEFNQLVYWMNREMGLCSWQQESKICRELGF